MGSSGGSDNPMHYEDDEEEPEEPLGDSGKPRSCTKTARTPRTRCVSPTPRAHDGRAAVPAVLCSAVLLLCF